VLNHSLAALLNLGPPKRVWIKDIFAQPLPGAAKVMLIANVCLAAIVVAEIFEGNDATPWADPIKETLAPLSPKASHGNPPSMAGVSADLERMASNIVSRPLLAPDRRPAHPRVASGLGETAVEPPVKLVGTIVSDHARIAILETAGKQKARVVGDSAGASRIVEINPGLIRLQSADGNISDVRLTWGTRIEPISQPAPPVRRSLLQ
jgi:hypothetical protein